jgi:hypothetical protein
MPKEQLVVSLRELLVARPRRVHEVLEEDLFRFFV